jgi:WD40 repeat protein
MSVALSPDGKALASGSDDGAIRLLDLTVSVAPLQVLYGHKASANSVVFSPDGQTLASGSNDGTIRLWSLTFPEAEPIVIHGDKGTAGISSVAFSFDGQTLASGSNDGTIRVWILLEELVEVGCSMVQRNLTWEEWQRYLRDEPYRQTCPNLPPHPSVPEEEPRGQ